MALSDENAAVYVTAIKTKSTCNGTMKTHILETTLTVTLDEWEDNHRVTRRPNGQLSEENG